MGSPGASDFAAKVAVLESLESELYRVIDTDPLAAIERAENLSAPGPLDNEDILALRAAVFIDAGGDLNDGETISRGVEIYRELLDERPEYLNYEYNLANGLSALARSSYSKFATWFVDTYEIRREARSGYEKVAKAATDASSGYPHSGSIAAQAKTNQGNLLKSSYRWLEAYDAYRQAMNLDPSNVVAATGAAKLLKWMADRGLGPRNYLLTLARGFRDRGKEAAKEQGRYDGNFKTKMFRGIERLPVVEPTDLSNPQMDDYTVFVADNNLALSPTIEGLHSPLERWDCLYVASVIERAENGNSEIPPIFAMFNALKSDYLSARWLAHIGLEGQAPETARYSDSLDYANYGVNVSLLILAQRSAIDILDRVAVAVTEYLDLPYRSARSIYFHNRWHQESKDGSLRWQDEIKEEIAKGNTALIALSELAEDFKGGYLAARKKVRHAGTHRFVVLHEMDIGRYRETELVEHHESSAFQRELIASLRIARASIFYLVEMIALREHRLSQESGIMMPLDVPWHDWIRGEEL